MFTSVDKENPRPTSAKDGFQQLSPYQQRDPTVSGDILLFDHAWSSPGVSAGAGWTFTDGGGSGIYIGSCDATGAGTYNTVWTGSSALTPLNGWAEGLIAMETMKTLLILFLRSLTAASAQSWQKVSTEGTSTAPGTIIHHRLDRPPRLRYGQFLRRSRSPRVLTPSMFFPAGSFQFSQISFPGVAKRIGSQTYGKPSSAHRKRQYADGCG